MDRSLRTKRPEAERSPLVFLIHRLQHHRTIEETFYCVKASKNAYRKTGETTDDIFCPFAMISARNEFHIRAIGAYSMERTRTSADLTEAEIRVLLMKKARKYRQHHLQAYQRTGRAMMLVSERQTLESPYDVLIDDFGTVNSRRVRPSIGSQLTSRLLFLLELGAFVSIVALFWMGTQNLSTINQRASAAWVFPTPTPTPLIQAVVLPDGHTPPNRPGGAKPNVAEIPAHLRPLAQAQASIPTPTAAPEHGVRIRIPALNIDAPIVQGDGWEQLMKGVGQHIGTANPGEKGNMVLSGHNDVYGEVFRYLDRLKPGDQVIIFTFTRQYTYIIEGWTLVNPDQVEVMNPTSGETLTLISCYPYLIDTQRIIVKARLMKG